MNFKHKIDINIFFSSDGFNLDIKAYYNTQIL